MEQNVEGLTVSPNGQQTDVSGSFVMQPHSEPITKECGTCWGGGKIDVDDDMCTVDCWTCGGSGRLKI